MAKSFIDKQCPSHGQWMNKNVPFFIFTPLKITAIQTVKFLLAPFKKFVQGVQMLLASLGGFTLENSHWRDFHCEMTFLFRIVFTL